MQTQTEINERFQCKEHLSCVYPYRYAVNANKMQTDRTTENKTKKAKLITKKVNMNIHHKLMHSTFNLYMQRNKIYLWLKNDIKRKNV